MQAASRLVSSSRMTRGIYPVLGFATAVQIQKPLSKEYIERIGERSKKPDEGHTTNFVHSLEESGIQLGQSDSGFQRMSTLPGGVTRPFSERVRKILTAPVQSEDIEIKGDGLIYLPEIRYRRILTAAFGSGGWALIPMNGGVCYKSDKDGSLLVTREFALFCDGQYVSQAVGEHNLYGGSVVSNLGKALESAKSNALTRCCKDLCIASELWDRRFITNWLKTHALQVWCMNTKTNEKKRIWRRKGDAPIDAYPWKEATR